MLLLVAGSLASALAQPTSTIPATHKVKKGETLYGIGRQYGMTVPQLQKMNPGIGVLQPGMKLNVLKTISLPTTPSEAPAAQTPVYGTVTHTVQSGETLYALSRKYGVGVAEIKTENGLTSDMLSVGQRLRIPRQLLTQNPVAGSSNPAPVSANPVPVDDANPSAGGAIRAVPNPADNRAGGMPDQVRNTSPSRSMENKQWSGRASVNSSLDATRPWVYFDGASQSGSAPLVVAVVNPVNQQVLYCTVQGKPAVRGQLEVSQWVADRLGMVASGAPVLVTFASPIP